MSERTGCVPRSHYADREWRDLRELARPGHWTLSAACRALRRGASGQMPATPLDLAVISWAQRDLDLPSSESDVDRMYTSIAASGTGGEDQFLSGRRAMDAAGYGDLAGRVDPWTAERYRGLGCPWLTRTPGTGERVLDLGCGSGVDRRLAEDMVGASGRAIGVDRRPFLIAAARRRGDSACWVQARAECLPFRDGWATTVVANGLPPLLRAATATDVLREAARLLRPGGWLHAVVLVAGPDVSLGDVDDLLLVNSVRVGKPLVAEYRSWAAAAGFRQVAVTPLPPPFAESFRAGIVRAVCLLARR